MCIARLARIWCLCSFWNWRTSLESSFILACCCSTVVDHTPAEQNSWGHGLNSHRPLAFFLLFKSLRSVSLIRSHEEVQHYRFSRHKMDSYLCSLGQNWHDLDKFAKKVKHLQRFVSGSTAAFPGTTSWCSWSPTWPGRRSSAGRRRRCRRSESLSSLDSIPVICSLYYLLVQMIGLRFQWGSIRRKHNVRWQDLSGWKMFRFSSLYLFFLLMKKEQAITGTNASTYMVMEPHWQVYNKKLIRHFSFHSRHLGGATQFIVLRCWQV